MTLVKRLLSELVFFFREVRAGFPRQLDEEFLSNMRRKFIAMDLAPATYAECADAASKICPNERWVGAITNTLFARCGRSKDLSRTPDFAAKSIWGCPL